MAVGELEVAIRPALQEILTAEEPASTSIRVTDRCAPLSSLDDQETLSGSTRLQVFTLGDSAIIRVDGSETAGEVYAEVRSDLQASSPEAPSAEADCAPGFRLLADSDSCV